jgi:hypothetical protein
MWLACGNHHDVAGADESRPHTIIESRLAAKNDDDLVVGVFMERHAAACIGADVRSRLLRSGRGVTTYSIRSAGARTLDKVPT